MRLERIDERKLSQRRRDSLPDSDFGIPETRSYPMPDRSHVLSAIRMFNRLGDRSREGELAANIIAAVHRFGMEDEVSVGPGNRFLRYWRAEPE